MLQCVVAVGCCSGLLQCVAETCNADVAGGLAAVRVAVCCCSMLLQYVALDCRELQADVAGVLAVVSVAVCCCVSCKQGHFAGLGSL